MTPLLACLFVFVFNRTLFRVICGLLLVHIGLNEVIIKLFELV